MSHRTFHCSKGGCVACQELIIKLSAPQRWKERMLSEDVIVGHLTTEDELHRAVLAVFFWVSIK